ncbi:MAG: CHAD domain-containing protein, partial [Methyloceanibacter sp.]
MGAAFRRIAGEQIDKALAEAQAADEPVAWRVHQLRKRCKKIRALARLVRPGLEDYESVNRSFRDSARLLSSQRDARVMRDLVVSMAKSDDRVASKPPVVRVFRLNCTIAEQLAEPALGEVRRRLAREAVDIERLGVDALDFGDVCRGVEKTLGRAHEALRRVADDGTSAAYHEWRKRCKYHWYHLRLLRKLLPEDLADRGDSFDKLGKIIGNAHDRSVLLDRLELLPAYLREDAATRRIAALALRQRRELRRRGLQAATG